ncbi:hypothetical protein pipiens_006306, partial [Culex pipiens pipiens]
TKPHQQQWPQFLNRIGQLGLGVAIVGGVVNSALYNVDGGHRAVIFDRFTGVKQTVSGEGTHFFVPWVQRPVIFDIRSQPRNVPVVTGSKELQNVNITLRDSVPTGAGPAAEDLHHPGSGLRRACAAVDYDGSVEGRGGPVRRR